MLRDIKRRSASVVGWLSVVLLALALVGCGQPQELSEEQAAQLEQRVRERWLARSAHDFAKAWEYTSPNYRKSFPKSLYIHKFSYTVNWELTGIEVVDYDARAAVASVAVRVMSEPAKFTSTASRAVGATPVIINETWIFMDGEWWYSVNF